MMWRSQDARGLVLAAGCTLDSSPDATNGTTRAAHDSPAWQPDTLHVSTATLAAGATSNAPVSAAAGRHSDAPAAPSDHPQPTPNRAAAAGSGGDSHAGSAGSAIATSQPSAAGAPAAGSGGSVSDAGDEEQDGDLGSALIDLTLRILFGGAGVTVQAASGVLEGAATAGGLTASLVSGALESLTSAGICVAEPDQCERVRARDRERLSGVRD